MPRRVLTGSELVAASVPSDEETHLRIEMGRSFIWEAAALADFLNKISATPISTSRGLSASGEWRSAIRPQRRKVTYSKRRSERTSPATPAVADRWSSWRPGLAQPWGGQPNWRPRENSRSAPHTAPPASSERRGCFVLGGGRAPVVSGMRRNPEPEIPPLSPEPWLGSPPGPPALSLPRASN
jgi:hypothetical protein